MWIVFSILSALLAGAVVTLSKAGIKDVDSTIGFAVQSVLILLVSWIAVFWQGQTSQLGRIAGRSWVFLILAGVLTCFSSLFLFRGLKLGDANRVSPLNHAALIFAVVFALIFLKEHLNWQIIVGIMLMSAGVFFIAFAPQAAK